MKSISLCLAALLSAGSPLTASDAASAPKIEQETQKSTSLSLSKDYLNSIRSRYENGQYQEFLEEMELDYARAKQDKAMDGLIALRKEEALIAKAQEKTTEKWNKLSQSWENERNKELLKLIGSDTSSPLAQKIRSIAEPLDPTFKETLTYFFGLRNLTPGQGKNEDENILIDRDIELAYKQGHFNSLMATKGWSPDAREKLIALHFDLVDKLLKDAKEFKDKDLQMKVETLASALDIFYERKMDAEDLQRLALGANLPANDQEKKAADIIAAYAEKFSEQTKEFFQAEANQ